MHSIAQHLTQTPVIATMLSNIQDSFMSNIQNSKLPTNNNASQRMHVGTQRHQGSIKHSNITAITSISIINTKCRVLFTMNYTYAHCTNNKAWLVGS